MNDELKQVLEGVFIRSRLKPIEYDYDSDDIVLHVCIRCDITHCYGEVSLRRNYYDVEAFGYSEAYVDYYDETFIVSGIGEFDRSFKAVVENVVTVYIKEAEGF